MPLVLFAVRVLRKKKTDTGNIDTKRKKKLDTNVNRAETKYAEPGMLQVTSAVVKESDLRIDSDIDVASDTVLEITSKYFIIKRY